MINDREAAYGGAKAIFAHYGIEPPSIDTFFNQILPDYVATYRQFSVPKSATKKEISQIWQKHFATRRNGIALQPGVRELLLFLRDAGLKCGIVSGEATSILDRRLPQFNLRQLLNLTWGDCVDKRTALLRACSQLKVRPQETVYVDDNHRGLVEAKIAGLITIGFAKGWQSEGKIAQANPNFRTDSMYRVKEIITDLFRLV